MGETAIALIRPMTTVAFNFMIIGYFIICSISIECATTEINGYFYEKCCCSCVIGEGNDQTLGVRFWVTG